MAEPMSLEGGILMYNLDREKYGNRYKVNFPPKGRKVVFLADNGYEVDVTNALRFFPKGTELTVEEIYVGHSYSTVKFEEYPDIEFNTVMFTDKKLVIPKA